MKEKIKLEVTVIINYHNKIGREIAIKNAKECCTNSAILSFHSGAKPVKANLIK